MISDGIAANILLSVLDGPQQDVGYIQTFSVPAFVSHTPVPFTLEIANQGNHYAVTQGTITITNILLGSKDIITLSPQTLLAHTAKYIPSPDNASATKILWQTNFLFGIFRADAAMTIGNNPVVFHRSVYFYSYRTLSLIVGLIVLIFIGIVVFRIKRKQG